ncbi:hypothetical protein FSP39_001822 [Pinctada imbricata]|uniref:Major facilitator superfamily associated domain-containing protein n=1 Tax=Pinctada imbricata TaxID=66713 RepID=A0AA88YFL6_PINIB|nr:hypothetical protein FSP39_001822 [Pinctada imbricata]
MELEEKKPVVKEDPDKPQQYDGTRNSTEPKSDTKSEKNICENFCKFEPDLVPYKLFYFSFYGAIGAIFPFMSLYFKQLGFSPNQIGLISGVRPLIGFVVVQFGDL